MNRWVKLLAWVYRSFPNKITGMLYAKAFTKRYYQIRSNIERLKNE